MKKITSALLLLIALALPAMAQNDITSALQSTTIAAATTNSTPSAAVIGWSKDQILVLSLAMVTTNVAHATTRSNVVIRFDTSQNQTDWITNAYSMTVSPGGTADVYNGNVARITNSVGAKWLRVGAQENVNTNRIWLARFSYDKQ